jgi:O-antigen/teichoic acid export membrane protein
MRFIRTWQEKDTVLSRLLRNFSITFSGSLLLQVIALVRVPLLLKNIEMADYGKILIAANFFSVIGIFINIRVHDVMFRFLPDLERTGDRKAIAALHRLMLTICAGIAGLILVVVLFGGRWLSLVLYKDVSIHPLLLISLVYAVFAPFTLYASGVLRLRNRFSWLVGPEVAGGLISLLLLVWVLIIQASSDLVPVMWSIASGMAVGIVVPVLLSLFLVRREIRCPGETVSPAALKPYKRKLIDTLIDTNVITWLKFGTNTGGLFLLSILGSQQQVALFGLALRLSQPLSLLQNNLQTALNPEIVSLYGQRKLNELRRLIRRLFTTSALVGAGVLALAFLLIKPILLLLATPEYLAAVPVFYVYLSTIYLMFVSLPFFYLALSMDRLRRRNLIVAIRFIYLGVFIYTGLNAFTLALVLLLGEITVRLFNDIPLYRELKQKAATEAVD